MSRLCQENGDAVFADPAGETPLGGVRIGELVVLFDAHAVVDYGGRPRLSGDEGDERGTRMPSVDRKWRLARGFGYGVIAGAALLLVAFFISGLLIWGTLASALAQMDWGFFWFCLFGVGMGVMLVRNATQSRERERLRALALAGDAHAMPAAAIKPPLAPQAGATHQPLMLLWRPARLPWLLVTFSLFIAITLTFALVALLAMVVFPASSWLLLVLGAALVALEIGWFIWWWAQRRRASNGVIATSEGIRWLRPRKAEIFIPWDEARLFEVWRARASEDQFSGYALMSARALVEWREYSPKNAPAAADGASYEEMLRRSQAIVQTIIARSGLIPRTCEPDLAVKEEAVAALNIASGTRSSGWRRLSLVGTSFILALTAMPLVAAVGALVAPLTNSQPLNIYAAATMGATGLALLAVDVWVIAGIVRARASSDIPRPDVRLPSPPAGARQMSLRMRHIWRDHVIALGIGLLTIGDIYALIRGYSDFPEAVDRSVPWWDLHKVTITALYVPVLLLSFVAIAGIMHKGKHIVTDEQGLRSRRGREAVAIPWDMVAELVIRIEKGKIESYKAVAGDAQRTEVSWPADALWAGVAPSMPGESPAAVFAAAVAQRAGVTPTVEYT